MLTGTLGKGTSRVFLLPEIKAGIKGVKSFGASGQLSGWWQKLEVGGGVRGRQEYIGHMPQIKKKTSLKREVKSRK